MLQLQVSLSVVMRTYSYLFCPETVPWKPSPRVRFDSRGNELQWAENLVLSSWPNSSTASRTESASSTFLTKQWEWGTFHQTPIFQWHDFCCGGWPFVCCLPQLSCFMFFVHHSCASCPIALVYISSLISIDFFMHPPPCKPHCLIFVLFYCFDMCLIC